MAAVAARDKSRADAFALRHGIPAAYGSYEDMLADPDIDAIYNPLPNSLHGPWTLRAIAAGKHVLCEKPFASNADEAAQVADAAAASGLVVMEAMHYRYHPLTRRLSELVAELGPVQHLQCWTSFAIKDPDDIRYDFDLGGGALMDGGCYAIDCLRLLGERTEPALGDRGARRPGARLPPAGARRRWRTARWPSGWPSPAGRRAGSSPRSPWTASSGPTCTRSARDGQVRLENFIFAHRGRLVATKNGSVVADEQGGGDSTYVGQLRAFAAAIAAGGRPGPDIGGERRGDHAPDRRRVPRGRPAAAPLGMTPAGEEAARFAADLIRIDTTNRGGGDARERPAAEYVAARLAEAGLEPVLLESAPGRANVVARVSGTGADGDGAQDGAQEGALLLHGHLDVVPADPAGWSVHPFSGEIRDGVLWGRGAVDMKNADAVLLALVSQWARSGTRPRRDIVLAFTADEEDTAEFGARWLVERHRELFEGCTEAVGESGAFTFHAGPGQRLYPIASAERGTAWLKLTASGRAGHGAKPNEANAVIRLAEAITRIGAFAWPVRLIPTVRAAVEAIAASAGVQLPDGALTGGLTAEELLARLGPAGALVAGTVRNSANPTMLQAGYKINVIPGEAVGYVDGRVLPGYEAEFRASLDELTGADVTWEYAHSEIPLEAPLDAPVMASMARALLAEDPGSTIVPYCMSGGTDAKQFSRLGMTCYGFTPLVLPEGYDYYAMFHGTDERIPLSALEAGVRIMDRFLATAAG